MATTDPTALPKLEIGAITTLLAPFSYVIYVLTASWPANLGGWEIILFLLLGGLLILSALIERRSIVT